MLVFVRFDLDGPIEPAQIEETVQACVGRGGAVIGASPTSIDIELHGEIRPILESLAAALRDLGMPPTTQLDIPSSGQRFGILDF